MSDHESDQEQEAESKGTIDMVSVLYVLGGIPMMIVFFVVLFGLTGSCDQANLYIPA